MQNIDKKNIQEEVNLILRYDYFLKRSLSKNIYLLKSKNNLWHFLSIFSKIALSCEKLNKLFNNKFDSYELSIKNSLIEMINLLHKSYLTKNIELIVSFNEYEEKIIYNVGLKNIKKHNPIYLYILFSIVKDISFIASPLIEIIQSN